MPNVMVQRFQLTSARSFYLSQKNVSMVIGPMMLFKELRVRFYNPSVTVAQQNYQGFLPANNQPQLFSQIFSIKFKFSFKKTLQEIYNSTRTPADLQKSHFFCLAKDWIKP